MLMFFLLLKYWVELLRNVYLMLSQIWVNSDMVTIIWVYIIKFWCGKKCGVGQFTLQMTKFTDYHYKITLICRKIPYQLFYSFIRFQGENVGGNVFCSFMSLSSTPSPHSSYAPPASSLGVARLRCVLVHIYRGGPSKRSASKNSLYFLRRIS